MRRPKRLVDSEEARKRMPLPSPQLRNSRQPQPRLPARECRHMRRPRPLLIRVLRKRRRTKALIAKTSALRKVNLMKRSSRSDALSSPMKRSRSQMKSVSSLTHSIRTSRRCRRRSTDLRAISRTLK